MANHQTWADRFDSGEVARAVSTWFLVEDVAGALGCSVPALKRAWGRYGEGDIWKAIQGGNRSEDSLDASALDDMLSDIKLPGESSHQAGPEQECVVKPRDGERWLVPGDIHFGITDPAALALMQRCAEDFEIDRVVQQGDSYDCYGISRHNKQAARINRGHLSLDAEREAGADFQDWVAAISRESGVPGLFLPGNHEDRLEAVQDLNPGLEGALSVRRIFDLPDEIDVLAHRSRIRAGSLVIEHGHQIPGSISGYGCKRVLTRFSDQTTVFGHSHRMGEWSHTTYDITGQPRTRKAINIGHMSDWRKHAAYAPRPNWQQGFLLIEFWRSARNDLRYSMYPIEIHAGEFVFQGTHYR